MKRLMRTLAYVKPSVFSFVVCFNGVCAVISLITLNMIYTGYSRFSDKDLTFPTPSGRIESSTSSVATTMETAVINRAIDNATRYVCIFFESVKMGGVFH